MSSAELTNDDIEKLQGILEQRLHSTGEKNIPYKENDEIKTAVLESAQEFDRPFFAREIADELDDLCPQSAGAVLARLAEEGLVEKFGWGNSKKWEVL